MLILNLYHSASVHSASDDHEENVSTHALALSQIWAGLPGVWYRSSNILI